MSLKDRAGRAYQEAQELTTEVKESDAMKNVDTEKLVAAATDASGIKNQKGRVTKWQVAKAAANPTNTTRKVVTAVGKEVYRQHKDSKKNDH